MALDWKVISQRNWVKGLQATFSRFSQPQGILTRLSNLLYDQRGGLRTSDGSLIFSSLSSEASSQVQFSNSLVGMTVLSFDFNNFGFTIPGGATILGLQVDLTLNISASIGSSFGGFPTTAGYNNILVTTGAASSITSAPTQAVTLGGATYLGGFSWASTDINGSAGAGLGWTFIIESIATGTVVTITGLTATVYYDDGSPNTQVQSAGYEASSFEFYVASGFDFTIPGNATIDGIEAAVNLGNPNGTDGINSVVLLVNGYPHVIGTPESNTFDGASTSTVVFGGPDDLWGFTSWTPTLINGSTGLSCLAGSITPPNSVNDAVPTEITMTVYFTVPEEVPTLGPIIELALYQPSGVNPYYVGIQKTERSQAGLASGIVLTAVQVGGAVSEAVRLSGITTITFTDPHNLIAQTNPGGVLVQSGFSDATFNVNVSFQNISIINQNAYSYPDANPDSTPVTLGSVTTELAPGTYEYDVTASDGQGGETPGTGAPASIAITSPDNAVMLNWVPAQAAIGYDVYGRVPGSIGQLNGAGPQPETLILTTGFMDIGGAAPFAPIPPTVNTTQSSVVYKMSSPTFEEVLGVFPTFFAPPLGGIPGATGQQTASPGAGASPQGGVIGATCPLPQIVQFANKLIFALGNGYAPQEFLDAASGAAAAVNVLERPTTLLNGWGPGAHVGAYELGQNQSTGWGLNNDTTLPYTNPGNAFDGNNVTAASRVILSSHEYAGCIWSFAALGSPPKSLYLNILSSVLQISGGLRSAGIWYTLDGGTTWINLYNANVRPEQWDAIELLASQDASLIQVMAFLDSHDDMDHYVFDIQLADGPQTSLSPQASTTGVMVPVSNTFNAQYTDWQASVSWNQGDTIKDSVSGGIFIAIQAGTSGATRPNFVNILNQQTPELSPGTVVWKCTAVSFMGTPLRGAACAIVYAGSLWLANTWPTTTSDQLDGPNCIKMSDANNPESWNPANIAFLGKDDGDQITSLNTYTIAEAGISPTGSLVIFKNFSTYQVTGVFGATDLTIQQAQTDMGNVAGRSSQFIPGYGISRLTHLGFAYFNGVNDRLISEEIRPYIFGGEPDIAILDWNYAYLSKGAQAANPPMYVCACPIVAAVLTGVSFTSAGVTYPLFVRVEKITQEADGNWLETSISPEVEVFYDSTPAFQVTTPAAVTGVRYRVFAGYTPGGENVYLEQATFTAQSINLSDMIPGFSSFGNGGMSRIFCYDLVMKQWAIVDLPFSISALKQVRSPGTIPITVAGGANDGSLRRLFAGDQTWDNGDQVAWSFRSGELFQQGGSAKVFYRRLVIRGSMSLSSAISVSINLQGAQQKPTTGMGRQLGGNQWEMRIDIMKDAENANATISGVGPTQIRIESMDWYVKAKASGAPVSIQK